MNCINYKLSSKFNVLLTCIVIYPYDKNKQDELFTLILFQ